MLDIHFGIRREDIDAFDRILTREFPEISVETDLNNWNTWEPFADAVEEARDVLHVVIATMTPMIILNYMVSRMGIFLSPLEDPESAFNQRFMIVTDHGKWNQYYVELSYPE